MPKTRGDPGHEERRVVRARGARFAPRFRGGAGAGRAAGADRRDPVPGAIAPRRRPGAAQRRPARGEPGGSRGGGHRRRGAHREPQRREPPGRRAADRIRERGDTGRLRGDTGRLRHAVGRVVTHCAVGRDRRAVGPPPVASTSPVPTATPSASTSLLGLSPASVTFVSPDDGWVLGTGTCSSAPCAAIARTADGGRTWAKVSAPHASIVPGGGQGAPGISGLRFADARNGWAFGPDLWATHDGGATWARLTIPGLPADAAIFALASAHGTVHAVVLDGQDYRVASSPVGADDFRLGPVRVAVGAGPVPAVQLVLSGAAGWMIENDRTVVGGARLVNGAWVAWQPPCAAVVGPV